MKPSLIIACGLLAASPSYGAADETLLLRLGEPRVVPLLEAPARIFLDAPALAQLRSPKPERVLIIPEATGRTVLHAVAADGSAIATIELDIEPAAADTKEDKDKPSDDVTAINITLHIGKALSLPLLAPASNVFLADPRVASVDMTDPDNLIVWGQAVGETSLYALNDAGMRVGLYNLTVETVRQAPVPTPHGAATPPPGKAETDWIQLVLPEARIVSLPRPAKSAVSDNPAVVSAEIRPPARLLVLGRTPGETMVHAVDSDGKPVANVRVSVAPEPPDSP